MLLDCTTPHRRAHLPRHQAGLTLVELLVGIAIGLFLITGATSLFISNLDSSRRLLLETRLNQNIRSAAELITRDLRRAGYWNDAVITIGSNNAINPNVTITSNPDTANVFYFFNAPGSTTSRVEFSLSNNTLQMNVGGGPQELTDPRIAKVMSFNIVESKNRIDIGKQVIPAKPDNSVCLTERRYDISIDAESPTDASVKRKLKTSVRVRNDRVGDCS